MSPAKNNRIPNRLLATLPNKDYQELLPHLREVPLNFGDILYTPQDLINDVYFPNAGIISLIAGAKEQTSLEVGMVGNEGMVGINVFLGVNTSPNRGVVQGAGSALKLKATALRRATRNGGALSRILQRYTHSVLTQITQSAVCNQFHSIDARLARWLLMTQDRMADDEFQLTQNFVSHMLGVRREGVSIAAANLQRRELIRYSRGRLRVLNRKGLEGASCDCYEYVRREGLKIISHSITQP